MRKINILCIVFSVGAIFLFSSFSTKSLASNYTLKDLNKSSSLVSSETVLSTFFTTPHTSIEVSNDNELAATAVSGLGTDSDPYVLEGWNITTTSTHGIYIHDTSAHFIIRYCWVDTGGVWGMHGININNVAPGTATILNNINQNNAAGIHIKDSPASLVANNICLNNGNGISIFNSPNSFLVNNTCSNNRKYLLTDYVEIGLFTERSTHLTVSNNNCHDNNRGIVLAYSEYSTLIKNSCNQNDVEGICLDESSSVIVNNNSCQNNGWGIFLWISHSSSVMDNILLSNARGINLEFSNSNNITANNISNNGYGVYFHDSDYCIVNLNYFYQNNNYGVYIQSNSTNIYLDHNAFLLNKHHATQAADDGSDNRFIYNYWDEWTNPDDNDDGIVDNPYVIEGNAQNQDPYPLINTSIYDFEENDFIIDFSKDSDGDGMNDGWEYYNNLNPLINDASHDPDNDRLSNLDEYLHGTNPFNSDSDADEMPDGWEVHYNSDPLTDSTFEDPDYDDLINLHEYRYGTDPLDPDSDGDGLNDFSEVIEYSSDPNKIDSDGDGLTDYDEVKKYQTDPTDADSDNDSFPDGDDRDWIGNPRVAWDNPLTRSLLLILLFGLTLLGIWAGYISYHLPKLQRDLELLFQQFQQYALQFQESIIAIEKLEDIDEIEAVAEHVYQTFLSYENFYVFAQYLIIQKWLPPFLRPDLASWEAVFITMKNSYGEFQQIRLKRLEDKF